MARVTSRRSDLPRLFQPGITEDSTSLHGHLQLDPVIRSMNEVLPGTEVPLGRQDRSVTQEQLDLLKLSACRPAKLRAGSSQIMRRDARNANFCCVLLKHLPNDLLTQALARQSATAVHGPEYMGIRNTRSGGPGIDGYFHPGRHRCGTDAA